MELTDVLSKLTTNIGDHLDQELDMSKIISSELDGIINYNMWLETIELQKQFNNSVASDWITDIDNEKYDYWMAILDEANEVLNSRHWKWWKDSSKQGEVDWTNVQVEMVDLFLFIMSLNIQNGSTDMLFSHLINHQMNTDQSQFEQDPDQFFNDFWNKFLMAVQMKNLPLVTSSVVEFWFKLGLDVNDLFIQYRIKSALNDIRQEFGYNDGNYIKHWLVPSGEKLEDNIIAKQLVFGIELDENTIENMKSILRTYYLKYVAV